MINKLFIALILFSKCLNCENPESLLILALKKTVYYIENNNLYIDLNKIPYDIAQMVVNVPYQHNDTLVHAFARRIPKNKIENPSIIDTTIEKLAYLIDNNFISDVDRQGDNGETVLHILAQIPYDKAAHLMFKLIHEKKACVRIPDANNHNIMETSILAENDLAVKMLHGSTNAICNINKCYIGLCFVTMIEERAKNEKDQSDGFFTYLKTIFPRFKQLASNRHVLAPCCKKGGHSMYYSKNTVVKSSKNGQYDLIS
jgi:hypothetical protein